MQSNSYELQQRRDFHVCHNQQPQNPQRGGDDAFVAGFSETSGKLIKGAGLVTGLLGAAVAVVGAVFALGGKKGD